MDLHNKKLFFPIVFLGLVIIGLIMFIIVSVYDHMYGMKHVRSEQVSPEVGENEYNIVFKGQFNGIAFVEDDYLYFDMDVVNEDWAMGRYFYSDVEDVVFFTTSTERISYEVGSEFYKQRYGRIFVRASECEDRCGLQYKINYDEKLVMIRDPQGKTAEVMKSGVYLLTEPSEDVLTYTAKLKKGETIEVYDCDTEGYYFASDMNGHMGYLPSEGLKVSKANLSRKESQKIDMSDYDVKSNHIFMVFQQIYSNRYGQEILDPIQESWAYTNVVSPTWFKLNKDGSIATNGNVDYVTDVREEGDQIWALFDNRFDDDMTYELLKSTAMRDSICQSLLKYCKLYRIHGINVDFEAMSERTERYFMQFLRELSMTLRPEGYLLSVDVPVPSPWSDYYQRLRYSEVCDYVIVMAYDEHYPGSDAGSTSSRDFVWDAVKAMVEDEGIQSRKIILGIPWYTRLWIGEGEDLDTEALSMDEVIDLIYDYDLTVTFDEETGQNYAEGYNGDLLYRIWIEDETSLAYRLQAVKDYDLKGVAAWSFGFENWQVWDAYDDAFFNEEEE